MIDLMLTSQAIVQRTREEREKRELLRRQNESAIVIQTQLRGLFARNRTKRLALAQFSQLANDLLGGGSESSPGAPPDGAIGRLLTCFNLAYYRCGRDKTDLVTLGSTHPIADADSLSQLGRILLSKSGRDFCTRLFQPQSIQLALSQQPLLALAKTLLVIVRYLSSLPPATQPSVYAKLLRLVEYVYQPTSSDSTFSQSSQHLLLWRYLVQRHFTLHLVHFINQQTDSRDGFVDDTNFRPDLFACSVKSRALVSLALAPLVSWPWSDRHTASNSRSSESTNNNETLLFLFTHILNDILLTPPPPPEQSRLAQPQRIVAGIGTYLLTNFPASLTLIGHLCRRAVTEDLPTSCLDHNESSVPSLIASSNLLYLLVVLVCPRLQSSKPGEASSRPQQSTVDAIVHLTANLAINLVKRPFGPALVMHLAATSSSPSPPTSDQDDSDDSQDDAMSIVEEQDAQAVTLLATTSNNKGDRQLQYWPTQFDEIFASLHTQLPSLFTRTSLGRLAVGGDKYSSTHLDNVTLSELTRSLAFLHYLLTQPGRRSPTEMVSINTVYSTSPVFLNGLWRLICQAEVPATGSGEAMQTNDNDDVWASDQQHRYLLDLLSSGKLPRDQTVLQTFLPLLYAYTDCLHHRLLCQSDEELASNLNGLDTDLPQLFVRLTHLLVGLVSIAHPNLPSASRGAFKVYSASSSSKQSMPSSSSNRQEKALELGVWTNLFRRLQSLVFEIYDWHRRSTVGEGDYRDVHNLPYLPPPSSSSNTLPPPPSYSLALEAPASSGVVKTSTAAATKMLIPSSTSSSSTPLSSRLSLPSIDQLLSRLRVQQPAELLAQTSSKLRYSDKQVALLFAPGLKFGRLSLLNARRKRFANQEFDSLSPSEVRQITVLKELPFTVPSHTRITVFQQRLAQSRSNPHPRPRIQRAVRRGSSGSIERRRIRSIPFGDSDEDRDSQDEESFDTYYPPLSYSSSASKIDIVVRRSHLYEDAFDKLSKENEPDFKLRLHVRFINQLGLEEMGVDIGGLAREFLTQLVRTAFDPTRGFFMLTAERTLYPNPMVKAIAPDNYKRHFFFLGRLLGKVIYDSMLVDLQFAQFFLAKLLLIGRRRPGGVSTGVGFAYLKSLDPELYKQLLFLKSFSGNFADLGLDFTFTHNVFGQSETVELKPDGRKIAVTADNRIEYMHLVAHYKLNRQINAQVEAFALGLNDVIDLEWLRLFDADELQTLISGADMSIDIDDLERHTVYSNEEDANLPVVSDFWSVLRSLDETQKRSFLRFVTSCSRPPMFGFKDLQPPFTLQLIGDLERLPTASTCMNILRLPAYSDRSVLRERLLYALNANAGFEYS